MLQRVSFDIPGSELDSCFSIETQSFLKFVIKSAILLNSSM